MTQTQITDQDISDMQRLAIEAREAVERLERAISACRRLRETQDSEGVQHEESWRRDYESDPVVRALLKSSDADTAFMRGLARAVEPTITCPCKCHVMPDPAEFHNDDAGCPDDSHA